MPGCHTKRAGAQRRFSGVAGVKEVSQAQAQVAWVWVVSIEMKNPAET